MKGSRPPEALIRPLLGVLGVAVLGTAIALIVGSYWREPSRRSTPDVPVVPDPDSELAGIPSFSIDLPIPRSVVISSMALSEPSIGDSLSLERVRLVYAAAELEEHLRLGGVRVTLSDEAPLAFRLMTWDDPAAAAARAALTPMTSLPAQAYAIVPSSDGVSVVGGDALGTLYGVYRLLEELGFRWFDPRESHVPTLAPGEVHSWRVLVESPRARLRGFRTVDHEAPPSFLVWMARNRLNLVGPADPMLARKLGITLWAASHSYLPEALAADSIFRRHPDWYGSHRFRRQRITDVDSYFNPAFSNPEMGLFVGDALVERLRDDGDLSWAGLLSVWPADARSGTFDESFGARRIGNASDNLLSFQLRLSKTLEAARREGQLSRNVSLGGIGYYETWDLPTNEAIVDRVAARDFVQVLYLNERDWNAPVLLASPENRPNQRLSSFLGSWAATPLSRGVCEFHNYSMLGGLAFTNLRHLFADIRALTVANRGLYCYMHPLLSNAGPRRILDLGLARASWASNRPETQEEFLRGYFEARYGPLAGEWLEVHEIVAASLENVRQMFLFASLEGLLLDQRHARPEYRPAEVLEWIPRYEAGGTAELPARLDLGSWENDTFVGLSRSLSLQAEALRRWTAVRASAPVEWGPALDQDISWFESTLARYALLAEAVALFRAEHDPEGPRVNEVRSRANEVLRLCDALDGPLLRATVSGIDQAAFLPPYRAWARSVLGSSD